MQLEKVMFTAESIFVPIISNPYCKYLTKYDQTQLNSSQTNRTIKFLVHTQLNSSNNKPQNEKEQSKPYSNLQPRLSPIETQLNSPEK